MQVLRHKYCVVVLLYSLLLNHCQCLNLKLFNASKIQNEDEWSMAAATWYGPPNGGGSDGGACGYGDSVEKTPLSKMVSAGNPNLFNGGSGCGACYEVKCTENSACSGKPVNVIITDECAGGCDLRLAHFDLSGTAFGSMATPNEAENLCNVGQLNILYRRVACSFGKSIMFTIDDGANPYYFATEIEYENGDGDILDIELKQANSDTWLPMKRSWGARWALNLGSLLQAPFSIRLTESNGKYNSKTIVADNVIPHDWKPGQIYRSVVNF